MMTTFKDFLLSEQGPGMMPSGAGLPGGGPPGGMPGLGGPPGGMPGMGGSPGGMPGLGGPPGGMPGMGGDPMGGMGTQQQMPMALRPSSVWTVLEKILEGKPVGEEEQKQKSKEKQPGQTPPNMLQPGAQSPTPGGPPGMQQPGSPQQPQHLMGVPGLR